MSQVGITIYRRTTYIHAHMRRAKGVKIFFLAGKGVVYFEGVLFHDLNCTMYGVPSTKYVFEPAK
jgi:hypothetical protein